MKIPRSEWVWMGHPAHFICAQDCKFFLATRIGDYIVSTVGEYFPDAPVREIFASSRNVKLEGMGDARRADYMRKIGFEDLGIGRKYETMVFKAVSNETPGACPACPYRIESGNNIDGDSYVESKEAFEGHYAMCEKWSDTSSQSGGDNLNK